MSKFYIVIIMICTLVFGTHAHVPDNLDKNPFLMEWDTPFGAPPFDKIEEEHFLPAYKEAIRQHQAEIDAIVNNPESPDFENTIAAYDGSGSLMRRISPVFGGLRGAETNPRLQEIARQTTPMISEHYNSIRLNEQLFERINFVYSNREQLDLTREQFIVVEKIHQDFQRGGAALPDEKREQFKKISARISMVSLQLSENSLAENNAFQLVIEDPADLAGLPANVVSAAAEQANKNGLVGKWVFTTANPSRLPFLQFSEQRHLREKIFKAYVNRGDNEN